MTVRLATVARDGSDSLATASHRISSSSPVPSPVPRPVQLPAYCAYAPPRACTGHASSPGQHRRTAALLSVCVEALYATVHRPVFYRPSVLPSTVLAFYLPSAQRPTYIVHTLVPSTVPSFYLPQSQRSSSTVPAPYFPSSQRPNFRSPSVIPFTVSAPYLPSSWRHTFYRPAIIPFTISSPALHRLTFLPSIALPFTAPPFIRSIPPLCCSPIALPVDRPAFLTTLPPSILPCHGGDLPPRPRRCAR